MNLLWVARIDSDQPLAHNFSPAALKRTGARALTREEGRRRVESEENGGRAKFRDCVFMRYKELCIRVTLPIGIRGTGGKSGNLRMLVSATSLIRF